MFAPPEDWHHPIEIEESALPLLTALGERLGMRMGRNDGQQKFFLGLPAGVKPETSSGGEGVKYPSGLSIPKAVLSVARSLLQANSTRHRYGTTGIYTAAPLLAARPTDRLSEHFTAAEFMCHDTSYRFVRVAPELELEFENHQRYELDMESYPHILSLHIKCKQGHLKVLRAYQRVECWVVRPEGQVEPLELLVCDLVKHDTGRGFWTYFARVKRLPGADTVVRLRLSELADEEVNSNQLQILIELAKQVVLALDQTASASGPEKKRLALQMLAELARNYGLDPPQLEMDTTIEAAVRLTKK